MKHSFLLAALIFALGTAAFAQNQKTSPDDPAPVKQKSYASPSNGSKNNANKGAKNDAKDSPLVLAGTNLEAELQSMIDVRKSNVGDQVVLKTTKAIKQNGEVVVPKGANLIGRITEVKRKTKDDASSRVGMVFDRIKGKNLDMPVNASVIGIVTANATAAAGDLFSSDLSGSGSASGTTSAGRSSGGGGGGLLGGVAPAVGGLVNTTTSTVGNVAGTAVSTVGGTAGTVGRTVNGLQISQSASGSANGSSSISARGKDVKVEKGATFQLRLDGTSQVQE